MIALYTGEVSQIEHKFRIGNMNNSTAFRTLSIKIKPKKISRKIFILLVQVVMFSTHR